jgi:YVTN family beta-propeller protein
VTNKVYVVNTGGYSVSVIDGATNGVSTVTVGFNPWAVGVNPVTNTIYVPNLGSNNVTVIDGATNGTSTVTVGSSPLALAVNPVTNKVYVVNTGGYSVSVIDGATNATSTIPAGSNPRAVWVNPVTNKIYVANSGSGKVTVIDGATNATTSVNAGTNPWAVGVNPVTGKIYAANYGSGNVTVITEAPAYDTKVQVAIDPLPGDTTKEARPVLAGKGVNRWTLKPTTRIEGVIGTLNSEQRPWTYTNITYGAGTDSVRWAWNWGTDSLVKGENFVLGAAFESDAATTNNLGLGSPFTGNLLVYPLYRMFSQVGVETEGRRLDGRTVGRLTATPNPFTSFAKVPGHESDRFNLYDVTGRKVGTYKGDRIGGGLVAGVYFLRPENGSAKPVRIVKIR